MKCQKECSCIDCENLQYNHPITFVEQKGLNENRATLVGYKCTFYGQCSERIDNLKTSNQLDDIIYINNR